MKSPHNQRPDDQARADTEKFIARYARKKTPSQAKRAKTPAKAR
jgi:myo-inositol-1-phosphate synthase